MSLGVDEGLVLLPYCNQAGERYDEHNPNAKQDCWQRCTRHSDYVCAAMSLTPLLECDFTPLLKQPSAPAAGAHGVVGRAGKHTERERVGESS